MNTAIYIPSLNREEICRNLIEKIVTKIPVYIVTHNDYDIPTNILKPEKEGIGYARNFIVNHAKEKGYSHIIMVDDDVLLPEYPEIIFKNFLEHQDLAWCGFYFENIFVKRAGYQPNTGFHYTYSLGSMGYAVDVEKIIEAGNFDINLKSQEEEVGIRLMKIGSYKGIDTDLISKNGKRFSPGGISTYGYSDVDKQSYDYLIKKYGNYFFKRKNSIIFMWMKMKRHGFFPLIDFIKIKQYKNNKNKTKRSLFE